MYQYSASITFVPLFYQTKDYTYCECEHDIQSVLDLRNIDTNNLSVGDTIVGILEYLGWVVVTV